MKKYRTRFITCFLSVFLLLCTAIMMGGCTKKASDFTEEEHIARITERMKENVLHWDNPEAYQDFQVYPIYDKDETLKYFLVEFNPQAFIFGYIKDEYIFAANRSMYVKSANVYWQENPWTPYVRNENSPKLPSLSEGWAGPGPGEPKLDENGNLILHTRSPYFVTGNINARKYLLQTVDRSSEFICAVKENGEFINLISGLKLVNYRYEVNATLYVHFIASSLWDL